MDGSLNLTDMIQAETTRLERFVWAESPRQTTITLTVRQCLEGAAQLFGVGEHRFRLPHLVFVRQVIQR